MTRYFDFVLRHRYGVLIACGIITAISLANISRAVIATSIGKLFLGESPAYQDYVARTELFGNDEILIIGIDATDILQPAQQERLQKAIDEIEEIPSVGRVESVLNAQHIWLRDDTLLVTRYAREAAEQPDRIPDLLSAMQNDPLVKGLILSPSGNQSAVIVELKPDPERPVEEGPRLVQRVLHIFEEAGYPRIQLHQAGMLAVLSEIMSQTQYNLRALFPIVVVILFLTVWFLFRRFWPGVISVVVSGLAVVWTTGFAVLLDRQVDIIMSMVPAVIFIVSFSDVVHLCSAYLIELGNGMEKQLAIRKTARDVGRACFYTSITTFAGFLSLSLVPVPIFRKAGIIFSFGVASALLLAMTLTPIIFSLLRQPAPLRKGTTSFVHEALDRILERAKHTATGRPKLILLIATVVCLLSLIGLLHLKVETDFVQRLGIENPVRKDQQWFDKHFAGTNTVDMYIEAAQQDGLLDAGLFQRIARYQTELERMNSVDRGLSLVDLIKRIHMVINEGEPDVDSLPATRPALAQYLLLFEMGGGEDIDRLIDFDRRTMRILLRLPSGGFRLAAATGSRGVALAKEILGNDVLVKPSGLYYLLGDWLDEILIGQQRGILVSLVLVTIMMTVALRSVRAGLWAMVPNILPLLVLGGYVGGIWDQVDSDTLMIVYVATGIAVDDTIHFLIRYKIEESRCASVDEAISKTFDFTGRAIIMTTIILVTGFLPFASSDYFTIHILGTLLPFCLILALLADLFLLPAMVQVGLIRFQAYPVSAATKSTANGI